MIDAYDVLNLSFDADEEEIKKAYRRMSLQHHPDKVRASGSSCEEANAKFNEIKIARDILVDPDRRKIHDTFGIDLGEEKPELEVWTIGVGSMLSPMGTFALKTFVMRAVIWTMGWRYIGYLVLLLGMVVALLYAIDFKFREVKVRSQDGLPYVIGAGIAVGVVAIVWIWQLLADAAGIFYLASEVVDLALFVENWKIGLGAAITSFFCSVARSRMVVLDHRAPGCARGRRLDRGVHGERTRQVMDRKREDSTRGQIEGLATKNAKAAQNTARRGRRVEEQNAGL
mmetsp:Transcript_49262/g.141398  ORF Transcript_49262/g.141398 Transcript_49262/m.141398 type:complete len:285 (+) Transcript_49262:73-927(+)